MNRAVPKVAGVRFAEASARDQERGLLGYVSLLVSDSLRLDGVCLRRTEDGRLTLAYPSRRDRRGRTHPYLRPVCDEARRSIEVQVFAALGLGDVTR